MNPTNFQEQTVEAEVKTKTISRQEGTEEKLPD
jgi:hypothetical protein